MLSKPTSSQLVRHCGKQCSYKIAVRCRLTHASELVCLQLSPAGSSSDSLTVSRWFTFISSDFATYTLGAPFFGCNISFLNIDNSKLGSSPSLPRAIVKLERRYVDKKISQSVPWSGYLRDYHLITF